MNIVVCVKYVPDATADRHFESDKTVDRDGVDGLLSELDEYAVEQALQIKEKSDNPEDTTVTALCVGPEKAVDAVRKALQMGADRASTSSTTRSPAPTRSPPPWCWPRPWRRSAPTRPSTSSCAAWPRPTASMSVVPAMLAERLDLPQVTFASVVETQGDQVRIKRDGDTATEVVGGTLPLVVSVTDQTGEARYPSFKGIMAAKKKPVETYSLSDLGVDADQVGLSVAWTRGAGHDRASAAHRRRDRHRRGRVGRHCADRVPRLQEVHLRSDQLDV